jgi:hypothetical protein
MTTATQVQLRRGTSAQVVAFTGAQGELVVDTTNNRAVVHDGSTAGGFSAAKLTDVLLQRSIQSGGDLPITTADRKLNIKIATPLTIAVPLASTRNGFPLSFKNVATSTANATLTFSDGADGQTSIVLAPGATLTIDPFNDGVNNALGYGIA